jgi:hypothetical protein
MSYSMAPPRDPYGQDQLSRRQQFGGNPAEQQSRFVMQGAPSTPQFTVPGFDGLSLGGRTQAGDVAFEAPDASSAYNSFLNTYGQLGTAQLQNDASKFGSVQDRMARDLAALLGLQGIQEQVGGGNYQSDNQLEASRYSTDADRFATETNAGVARDQFKNQYSISDLESGRSLEGLKYGQDAETDRANIANLRYVLENEQFGKKMDRFDNTLGLLSGGQAGLGSAGLPSANLQYGDPNEAMNRAYAQSAASRASMMNQPGASGSSPQAGAYSARAAQQEAMQNAESSYAIPEAFRRENNENRLAALAALAEQKRANAAQVSPFLSFLGGFVS